MDNLLTEIRKYTKEKIILLEFKSENDYVTYFYQKLEKTCKRKKIDYINIDDNIKEKIISEFDFSK